MIVVGIESIRMSVVLEGSNILYYRLLLPAQLKEMANDLTLSITQRSYSKKGMRNVTASLT